MTTNSKQAIAFQISLLAIFTFSWCKPITISTDDSYDAHIEANEKDMAAVIWTTQTDSVYSINSCIYDGSEWTEFDTIFVGNSLLNARIKLDNDGNRIATWDSINDNGRVLFASKRHYQGGWSEPERLAGDDSILESNFTCSKNGLYVISWIAETDQSIKISFCRFDQPWCEPINVVESSAKKSNLSVKTDETGNAIITWIESASGTLHGIHSITGVGALWSEPYALFSDLNAMASSLTLNASGNGFCSIIDSQSGYINTKAFSDFKWSSEPSVLEVQPLSVKIVHSSGGAYLAWLNSTSGTVQSSQFIDGVYTKHEEISKGSNASCPALCVDSSGEAVLGWKNLENSEIEIGRFDGTQTSGNPIIISSGGDNNGLKLISSSNNQFAVWCSINGTNESIQVSVDTPGLLETVVDKVTDIL